MPRAKKRRPPRPLERGDRNLNPKGVGLLGLLIEDWKTHDRHLLSQGFLVLALHRLGNWRMGIQPKLMRAPFSAAYKMAYPLTEVLCGIKLSYTVRVGRRVRIDHFGAVLGARSIGDDCVLRQNTTLGIASTAELTSKPTIEDRVDIGAGVAILGDVVVGHDSTIGANAVVIKDVPPHSVVVGVPGRVIKSQAKRKPTSSKTTKRRIRHERG